MTNGVILWVDDEIEHLRAHILFLEKKGYEITYVYDETEPLVSFGGKRALKVVGASTSEMKEENKWY